MDIVNIVLLLILALSVLAILQATLAIRHDHEVMLAGPRESLAQVNARLQATQENLKDAEEDLRLRREALANIADIQAEVDGLVRQKDELLAEWAQLEERREEVRAMRAETEEAWQRKSEIDRDLTEQQEALDQVQAKLERADRLVARIDELSEEEGRLAKRVETLRSEATDLVDAKENAARLRDEIETLERDTARLSGLRQAEQKNLESLTAEADAAGGALARSKAAHVDLAAQVAAKSEEVGRLDEQVRLLEARKAHLDRETFGAAGTASGAGTSDPLKELTEPPEVLRQLAEWPEWDLADEAEALRAVSERFAAVGLDYHQRVVRAFHTAMKVNETTQMAVLAGISGTGKSQLPRQYAAGMGIGFLQVPVQPRWDSPQDLMGFYNYIEGRFRPTDLARALYHLDQFNGPEDSRHLQDRMLLILLDEMNLARVEYYFSDFLSRLESRPRIDQVSDKQLRKDSEIELEIPMPGGRPSPRIFPGYNLLFAGTMNEDESTQSLSDKVVDRANVLRFSAPKKIKVPGEQADLPGPRALSRARWSKWVRKPDHLGSDQGRVEAHLATLVELMNELHRPFGHRLGLAIMSFVANYPVQDGRRDIRIPLADQVEMRLLPKLRGIDVENSDRQIRALADYVEKDLQDSVLAEAVRHSLESARQGIGTFLWRGVTRE